MTLKYNSLKPDIAKRIDSDRRSGIKNPYRFENQNAIRRSSVKSEPESILRPVFVRDCEKILHLPLYNRYTDKTQVFSLINNDDITRRGLHVQLVSRIARNIGSVLGLNLELIEAIALGHDIGHTPFGHTGEKILDRIYNEKTGRHFFHNVHSVRLLDGVFKRDLTLQTLDGILCHNGELEMSKYEPSKLDSFDDFDYKVEKCCTDGAAAVNSLAPSTLEGCVVRISDIIAYLGKDRQDARIAGIINDETVFTSMNIGVENAAIINNIVVDIINNSYGNDCIAMSDEVFESLAVAKEENYKYIYNNPKSSKLNEILYPMFRDMFSRLYDDLEKGDTDCAIYRHHIDYVNKNIMFYSDVPYGGEENQIVVDYMASMTDDYFVQLYNHLFPNSGFTIKYKSYFDDIK